MIKATTFFLVTFLAASCGTKPAENLAKIEANAAKAAQASPSPTLEILASESVLSAFKEAKLPITNVEVFTEETDTNKLLGRPNQYVGKINWGDTRAENIKFDKNPNSIEVFASIEDLQSRKNYTESVSKSGGIFNQYIYSHKNVLVRLTHHLFPKDAAQYETILKSL